MVRKSCALGGKSAQSDPGGTEPRASSFSGTRRLGIASLAFNRQVKQIILISGDADFVPAAKLARREGIGFILDPMWSTIRPNLYEHVDGLRSVCPRPATKKNGTAEGSK